MEAALDEDAAGESVAEVGDGDDDDADADGLAVVVVL